ncbi:uncharacterized protein [Haliotis cracherodii]|uniref:uncharacterized protein n=1 Tax=Haliotis cracherodii TaxID=6455 RepID=UPI0039E8137F
MHYHLSWILYLVLLCLAAAVCRAKQVCTFSEVVDSAGSKDDWKGYKVVQNPDKCKTFCRSFDWCTAAEFDFSTYSCYLYRGATSLSHKKESVYMKTGCTEVTTSPPTSVETRTTTASTTITESSPSTVKDTTPSRTSINVPTITESSPSTVKDTTTSPRTSTNVPTITESSPSTIKVTTPSRTSINVPTITESTPSTVKDTTTSSRTSTNVPTTASSITSIYVPTITDSSLSTVGHTTSASTSTTDMTQMVESGVIMPSRAAGNTALFRQRRTSTQATTTSRLSNLAQTNSFVPFLLWLRCSLAPTDIYNVATTTTTTTTAADSELVQTPVGSVRTETPLCQIDTIHAKNDRLCFNIDKFINWKFHVPGKTPQVFLVLSCDRCKPLHVSVPARCKGVVCFYVSKRGTILHVQEDHCKMPKSIFYQPQFPPTQMKKTAPQYVSDVSSSSLYPSRKDNVVIIHQDALYQMEPIPVNEAVTEGLTDPPMSNAADVSLNSSDTETVQHDRVPNVTASTRHAPHTFEERAPRPKVKEAQFHPSQTIAPSKQTQREKRRRSRRRRKGKHRIKNRNKGKQKSRRRKSRKKLLKSRRRKKLLSLGSGIRSALG